MKTQSIEVYDCEGKVVIGTKRGNYVLPPADAVAFANAMLQCASACGIEIEFETDKPRFSELQRAAMVSRIVHVMRTLKGKDLDFVAAHVVDTVLAGVL